jgi:LmbE family N-acetylglucosaminyl deacetylase
VTVIKTVDDIKKLGTILGIWAHPDDESFLAAGVMMAALQNGQQVACVTATRGELGVQDESKWPQATLGETRTHELESALQVLGISEHYWLDYPDDGCSAVDESEACQRLEEIIEQCKPDSILTFGPEGLTGHPDHQTVCKWALAVAKDKPITVYHAVHTQEQYDDYLKAADEKINMYFNIDKPPIAAIDDCAITFTLPPNIQEKKCQALEVMPSQTQKFYTAFGRDFVKEAFSSEYFTCTK